MENTQGPYEPGPNRPPTDHEPTSGRRPSPYGQPYIPQAPQKRRSILWPILLVAGIFGFFLLFLAFIVLVVLLQPPGPVNVSRDSVLEIRVAGMMPEISEPSPFQMFMDHQPFRYGDYLGMIRKASNDQNIKGILLDIRQSNLSMAQIQELHEALEQFKSKGKWIVATGEMWQEGEYFTASIADEIYLPPEGILMLDGFMSRVSFYGDLLKKYGVGVHVEAFGEFKSFADGYRHNGMSEPVRQATQALLDTFEDIFVENVSRSRELEAEDVLAALDRGIYEVDLAKELGFIDDMLYPDQVTALLAKKLNSGGEKPSIVNDYDYWDTRGKNFGGGEGIAIVYGQGAIESGNGQKGLFGDSVIASDKFIRDLKKARSNKNVKAIVLRIDSPGGSMLASDLIWREIRKTVEQGTPVIASMGSVAASGGYYMAMACDEIVAEPTTITGSIGVVIMRVDFEELYKDLLVNVEVVKTSPSADFFDPSRELTQVEIDDFKRRTKVSYERFVTKAAKARNLEYDALDKVARGRVWSGRDAHAEGLVDHLGSLNYAVKLAAEKANLQDYHVYEYPHYRDYFEMLAEMQEPQINVLANLQEMVPYQLRMILDTTKLKNGETTYVISPYHVEID